MYRATAVFFCFLTTWFCISSVQADDRVRAAASGVVQRMAVYTSWNKDCSSKAGIVKVIAKPQHGTLTPTKIQTTIPNNRFRPGFDQPCKGQPTVGFNVDYRSHAGFKGQDHFVLDVTFGAERQVVDRYSVNVR